MPASPLGWGGEATANCRRREPAGGHDEGQAGDPVVANAGAALDRLLLRLMTGGLRDAATHLGRIHAVTLSECLDEAAAAGVAGILGDHFN
jgi:hypothetical protein